MLNVITLFSGYDSQCLALNRLGIPYDLVAWAEIDPHAIKAHNALFPQWATRNLGDVSKVDWRAQAAALGCEIDLLTYSSPCQDFSQAGLQRGGEKGSGTRSSLLWECERAIETLRPKYLLMENVASLTHKKFLPLFNRWQNVLAGLGYTNYAQVLNAKNYGVPQNRERIFLVSIRHDCQPLHYYFPQPFPLEKRLKDVLETNVPDRYYLSQERLAGLKLSNEKEKEAGRGFEFAPKSADSVGDNAVSTNAGGRKTDNFLQEPCIYNRPHGYFDGDINKEYSPAIASTEAKVHKDWHTSEHRQILELGDPATSNSVTSVAKDSMIVEPAILQQQRTEEGKEIRRKHKGDKGIPYAHKELTPRGDGITNTLSTVEKDNLLAEPTIIEDFYPDRPARVYEEQAPTIRSDRTGLKVTEPVENGWTRNKKGEITDRHPVEVANCVTAAKRDNTQNYVVEPQPIKSIPSIQSIIEQAKTAHPSRGIVVIKDTPCWVRRLTERELFRLMDVNEPDIDTLLNAGISNTQLAKMAGNSIVVHVLHQIFKNLFIETTPPPNTQTQLF